MRILIAIPHYFDPDATSADGRRHGSLNRDPAPRVEALSACLGALRQHFGAPQIIIDIATRRAKPVNECIAPVTLDILICTTRGRHLLSDLSLPRDALSNVPSDVEPILLGFECHAALHERIGDYDLYGYMEDDLVIRDPLFFLKITWFAENVGFDAVLLPNRYEVGRRGVALKAYLDGDLVPEATAAFQDRGDRTELLLPGFGRPVLFHRPLNPHSGGFFLTNEQMRIWSLRPDFLERDTRFIGPLESAASLAVMRTFRVYKSAPVFAGFLEIEHHGTAFLDELRYES